MHICGGLYKAEMLQKRIISIDRNESRTAIPL